MSDRKKPRLRNCMMCEQPADYLKHGKCINCRIGLQMGRYAREGKLSKFRSKRNQK